MFVSNGPKMTKKKLLHFPWICCDFQSFTTDSDLHTRSKGRVFPPTHPPQHALSGHHRKCRHPWLISDKSGKKGLVLSNAYWPFKLSQALPAAHRVLLTVFKHHNNAAKGSESVIHSKPAPVYRPISPHVYDYQVWCLLFALHFNTALLLYHYNTRTS